MPEFLILLLACGSFAAVAVLTVGYIATSAARKKVECPNCQNKTPITHAYYIDEATGQKLEGEGDTAFAIFSAIGGVVIGLGVAAFVFFLLLDSLKDSCNFEGLSLVCTSYGGGMQVETTINLPIALIAFFASIGAIIRGVAKFVRASKSKGKITEHSFECPKCKHAWTEDLTVIPETATA